MVVEKLLRLYISDIHDKNDMDKFLEDISQKSKTAKANLIKVMFLVMMFKRAECEGDWPLDLHVVSKLQSYFSATGHHHYALYATYCLNDMKNLSPKVLTRFIRGKHTTRRCI